jgi:phage repressor protein C with HTH and peptisase S24 domain
MNVNTLAERARLARRRAGFPSQDAAAKAIGCSRGTVGMWESGGASSIGEYLYDAARVYKVRPDWLRNGEEPDGYPWEPEDGRRVPVRAYEVRAVEGEEGVEPGMEAMVEEVDVLLSGGPGTVIPDFVETKYRMPFQINWFNRFQAKPENVKLMRVNGDSMERTVFDGDRVAVHLADRRVVDGRVYAIIAGEAKVKRLFRMRDGGLRIVSDNPDKTLYPDEIVPPNELDSVYVIGRVIDKSGSGGL